MRNSQTFTLTSRTISAVTSQPKALAMDIFSTTVVPLGIPELMRPPTWIVSVS